MTVQPLTTTDPFLGGNHAPVTSENPLGSPTPVPVASSTTSPQGGEP